MRAVFFCLPDERQTFTEEKDRGSEETQGAQRKDQPQTSKAQPVALGVDTSAHEDQIAERDERIKEAKAQVAETAKNANHRMRDDGAISFCNTP